MHSSNHPSFHSFICPFFHPSTHPSFYPFVRPFFHPFFQPSILPSIPAYLGLGRSASSLNSIAQSLLNWQPLPAHPGGCRIVRDTSSPACGVSIPGPPTTRTMPKTPCLGGILHRWPKHLNWFLSTSKLAVLPIPGFVY